MTNTKPVTQQEANQAATVLKRYLRQQKTLLAETASLIKELKIK
jgi:hypothetical protein